VLGSVSAIGPAAMGAYLPGLPELARDFGVSPSAAQVTVTTYLLGLALGQLFSGPLSDVHGRRRPLVAGMAVFTVTRGRRRPWTSLNGPESSCPSASPRR